MKRRLVRAPIKYIAACKIKSVGGHCGQSRVIFTIYSIHQSTIFRNLNFVLFRINVHIRAYLMVLLSTPFLQLRFVELKMGESLFNQIYFIFENKYYALSSATTTPTPLRRKHNTPSYEKECVLNFARAFMKRQLKTMRSCDPKNV